MVRPRSDAAPEAGYLACPSRARQAVNQQGHSGSFARAARLPLTFVAAGWLGAHARAWLRVTPPPLYGRSRDRPCPDLRRNHPGVKRPKGELALHAAARDRYRPRLRRGSSVVERILGKAEVQGSNPCRGTISRGPGQRSRPPCLIQVQATRHIDPPQTAESGI